MAIKVTCPNGHELRVKDIYAGKLGLCPHCRAKVLVPKPEPATEEELISMLKATRAAEEPAKPAEEEVHQDPRHAGGHEESGISLLSSTPARRERVCPQCCEIVSKAAATLCPVCNSPLLTCTAPLTEEELKLRSKSICHFLGVRKQGDVFLLRFGEHQILDQSVVDKIGSELYRTAARPDCRNLVLNFINVEGLSSLMLGTMLMLQKMMETKGGNMKLCQVGPEIREVFETTKLGQIFEVFDNEKQALRSLGYMA